MLKIIYKLSIILSVFAVSLQAGLSENQKISTSLEYYLSNNQTVYGAILLL